MIQTERYEISFASLKNITFNLDLAVHSWIIAANKLYKETGIFVSAQMIEKMLASKDGSTLERCIVVTSTRNPMLTPNKADFYRALKIVATEVKNDLKNPYTTISEFVINVSFFLHEL